MSAHEPIVVTHAGGLRFAAQVRSHQVIVDQPTARVVSFTAAPSTIKAGQSANLVWETENADRVTISGIGQVNPTGTLSVSPKETTTYTITLDRLL